MTKPVPSAISFDEAIALDLLSNAHSEDGANGKTSPATTLSATVHAGWDIRGVPHGGYLLSLVGAAAVRVGKQPHPVSVAANFLAPPSFGPAELRVTIVREGKRQSVHQVELRQDNVAKVHATVTLGTLTTDDPLPWADNAAAPAIPSVEECLDIAEARPGEADEFPLHERLHLRVDPKASWFREELSGQPEIDGWLHLAEERAPDPLAVLAFADGFPPSIFEALGTEIGHVPTVQLTAHLFALPAPGWIQSRCTTRIQGGSFLDEDADVWDSNGRLVCTARQLAMLLPPPPAPPE